MGINRIIKQLDRIEVRDDFRGVVLISVSPEREDLAASVQIGIQSQLLNHDELLDLQTAVNEAVEIGERYI